MYSIKIVSASDDSILRDVCDWLVYKSNEQFQQTDLGLSLIFYQDASEFVNPLGSAKKKHKIVSAYFTLANFETFHYSSIDNIQLLILCKEKDFKYFGQDKLFSRLMWDLRELEEHGLVTASGHVVTAKPHLLYVMIWDHTACGDTQRILALLNSSAGFAQ